MFEIKHQKTKTLKIKPNGRSSDFVSPHFILGCNGGCNSYCYTNRFGRNNVRYEWKFKQKLVEKFKELHNEKNFWCDIRYIF